MVRKKTQSTSTVNHSKRLGKSKSTREGDEKPIIGAHRVGHNSDSSRISVHEDNQDGNRDAEYSDRELSHSEAADDKAATAYSSDAESCNSANMWLSLIHI